MSNANNQNTSGIPMELASLDNVPEIYRPLYVPAEDPSKGFRLNVSGAPSSGDEDPRNYRTRLDEFRQMNLSLKKANEDLQARLAQLDVDTLSEIATDVKEKKRRDANQPLSPELESQFQARLTPIKQDYDQRLSVQEKKLKEAQDLLQNAYREIDATTMDQMIRQALGDSGLQLSSMSAYDDVVHRILRHYQLEQTPDGRKRPIGKDADGRPLYGTDGQPMTIKDFLLTKVTETSPHLFASSSGGGASGSRASSNTTSSFNFGLPVVPSSNESFSKHLADIATNKVVIAQNSGNRRG